MDKNIIGYNDQGGNYIIILTNGEMSQYMYFVLASRLEVRDWRYTLVSEPADPANINTHKEQKYNAQ